MPVGSGRSSSGAIGLRQVECQPVCPSNPGRLRVEIAALADAITVLNETTTALCERVKPLLPDVPRLEKIPTAPGDGPACSEVDGRILGATERVRLVSNILSGLVVALDI